MAKVTAKIVALAAATCFLVSPAAAQFSERTLSLIVGYPAGGYVDAVARLVAAKMSEELSQQVVVMNRAGAGGNIGAQNLPRAAPDGYTIMIHGVSSMATHSVFFSEAEESQLPRMEVASIVASTPGVMTAAASLGVKDFKQLVERIKSEPGRHNYGTPGIGTPSYFWSSELVRAQKLDAAHVAFAGGSAALQELMAGRISWTFDTPIGSVPAIQTGKAVPMAVVAPQRIKILADVPTVSEVGLPALSDKVSTLYILAPAETPGPVITRINTAFQKVLKDRQFVERMDASGSFFPLGEHTPAQAQRFAIDDYEAWFKMAKDIRGQK